MYLPDTLRTLLSSLFVGKDTKQKVASIGQAVGPQAVIAPLQIGLPVQLNHLYRCRILVDTLQEIRYCSSYEEVKRFEKNAANPLF